MADDAAFPLLVSLACHDARTPLATAYGFARTLERGIADPEGRYVLMIVQATEEIGDILDQLALVARIEAGRWQPELVSVESGELVRAAAARVDGAVALGAVESSLVRVDAEAGERSLAAFARCVLRHGRIEQVELSVTGALVELAPVGPETAPIALGQELKDFGAAVAVRVIRALGGSVSLEGETLGVTLPAG